MNEQFDDGNVSLVVGAGYFRPVTTLYPFGGEFWKLGRSSYFRLTSQQFAGTLCFVPYLQ
jgi:hypothetical protein